MAVIYTLYLARPHIAINEYHTFLPSNCNENNNNNDDDKSQIIEEKNLKYIHELFVWLTTFLEKKSLLFKTIIVIYMYIYFFWVIWQLSDFIS